MIPALRVPLFLVAPLLSLIVSASAAEPIVDASFEQEYRDPFIRGSEKEESRVHELAMDRDGIVWAATHAGLRIVDGTTLRQPDGIEINGPVFSVAASRDGTITCAIITAASVLPFFGAPPLTRIFEFG